MSEYEVIEIVRSEVAERRTTASTLADTNPDAAAQLRAEAELLQDMIDVADARVD